MLSHGWRRFLLLLVAGALAGLSVPPLFLAAGAVRRLADPGLVPRWRRAAAAALGPALRPAFRHRLRLRLGLFHSSPSTGSAPPSSSKAASMLALMPFAIVGARRDARAVLGPRQRRSRTCSGRSGALRIVDARDLPRRRRMGARHLFSGFPFDLARLRAHRQRRDDAARLGHRRLRPDLRRRAHRDDPGADLAGRRARPRRAGWCRSSSPSA